MDLLTQLTTALGDRYRVERELVYLGGIGIMVAAALVLLSFGKNPSPWAAYGYAILLGVGYSATASLIPAMLAAFLESDRGFMRARRSKAAAS